MRPLRWILIAAAALLALLLAGVFVVTQWVDPEVFKPRIVAALSRATGRPVELPGEIGLAWYPWLALRTGEGAIGNPPGVEGEPLLRWREARIGARLLPLLRGEIELDRLRLVGARVALRRGADGRDNWSGLAAAAGGGGGGGGGALRLAGLDLEDGEVAFVDAGDGTALTIDGLRLETGPWRAGQPEPVALQVGFGLRLGGQRLLGAATLDTRIALPPGEALRLVLGRTRFGARGFADGLAADGVPFTLALPGATLDLDRSDYRASALELGVGEARLTLRELAYAQPGAAPPEAGAAFALAPTSLRALLGTLGIEAPPTTDPRALGSIATEGRLALRDGTLRVEPFALVLDDTRLTGRIIRGGAPPLAEFALAGDSMDLDRYLAPEDAPGEPFRFPGEALGALRARGTLSLERATLDELRLEGLVVRLLLDEQGLRGDPDRAVRR
ncbi:MAG: AsmA family protein [Steroidobacteraceae bacterium]|nr:AsmA family protein [Steroidobacteraceae bacterium]